MKHLFIVNPIAGGSDRTGEIRAKVKAAFRGRRDSYEVYTTKAPMDAAEKIRAEAETGQALRVYACGGDGTFNECACGAALRENVAVCPFPTGTGNDFCRMFGDEKDLFRDLDALLDGREVPLDLIDCNGRYSANICSVGIDARVGTSVHQYSKIPLFGGIGGYILSLVVNVFKGIATMMHVRCGDFKRDGMTSLVCACNGRYYGGGFNPSLDARPDDGVLDVFVVKKVNLVQLVGLLGKYASGRSDDVPDFITHMRTAEPLEIRLDKPDMINLDGEGVLAETITIRMVPGATRLIIPRGMHFFDRGADQL